MNFIIKKYVYQLTDLESGKVETIEKLLAFDKSFLDKEMEVFAIDLFEYTPKMKVNKGEERLGRKTIKEDNITIEDILNCDSVFTRKIEYDIKRIAWGESITE